MCIKVNKRFLPRSLFRLFCVCIYFKIKRFVCKSRHKLRARSLRHDVGRGLVCARAPKEDSTRRPRERAPLVKDAYSNPSRLKLMPLKLLRRFFSTLTGNVGSKQTSNKVNRNQNINTGEFSDSSGRRAPVTPPRQNCHFKTHSGTVNASGPWPVRFVRY